MESASKEHMAAWIREVRSLKVEVKELQEEKIMKIQKAQGLFGSSDGRLQKGVSTFGLAGIQEAAL